MVYWVGTTPTPIVDIVGVKIRQKCWSFNSGTYLPSHVPKLR